MREFLTKEIAIFNRFKHLECVTPIELDTKSNPKFSIDHLSEGFIEGLQSDFPHTVHTLLRSGGKLCLPVSAAKLERCSLCNSVVCPSDMILNETNIKNDNNTKACDNNNNSSCNNNDSNSCCNNNNSNSCCSSSSKKEIQMKIENFVCYSCKKIVEDSNEEYLPPIVHQRSKYLSSHSHLNYNHNISNKFSLLSNKFSPISTRSLSKGIMKIVHVPVNSDNYSYLIIDEESKTAAAVDPAEPKKVLNAAEKHGVTITHILTTHHHGDHSDGNEELTKALGKNLQWSIGGDDRIPAMTKKVTEGDTFKIGEINVKVYFTPCHTTGHVLYECQHKSSPNAALFTGDTLFIGGCGRFFEGTADQMYHNLIQVISKLPKQTQIYCGHEYTVKNLEFSLTVEPTNVDAKEKLDWAKEKKSKNEATVPSTIEQELTFNPFMRVHQKTIAQNLNMSDATPIQIMAELRKRKDNF